MKTGTLLASVLVVGSAVGHMATPSAVTACYEGGGPAEGYVHKETNLDFTVDRSSEKSVAFTESYNKFEGVSCSAVPAHKFGETAWCNTNGALCNRECPMSMPQKCADVDSFGVCTPTVKDICDTLQGSRDSCTSSSDAAQAKADDYLTVDVRASPCDGDEQSSTLNALKAYKVAYNNWATAFNNASQVCKVGETIRDYNGQSFMALHKNVDQVAKAAAAVCSEDDFNAEGSLPNLGSSEKNKAICEKMNNDLAKLSEDSQTSSKQIQCFSSKCQELSGKEATAFADMKAKFETFQANYDKYFAAAEGFNAKVEDKNAKLAAVQAAHVQLAEVKAATGAKFTKDYEVYHKFETGAANGNCGLTACEMESVCGYDIEADASAYVEKDANGNCRGRTVDLVEHCYAPEVTFTASNVKCSMTVDNAIRTVKYGNQDLTADSGSVDSWTSVKVFSFTDAGPTAKLEIYGEEYSNCDGCKCAGLGVHCVSDDSTSPWHNFVSDTTHWKSRVENSNGGDTEYATPCVSSSGFSLRGFSHDSRCDAEGSDGKYCKIWAAGAWANGAWANKYVRFSGSPYGPDTEQDTLFTIPTDDASQAECYGARYWDLRAAFGSDDTALGNHFTKYTGSGRENRDASCALSDAEARCYIDRYEDAKAFAGADLEKAREHYYETGISEHRDFVCPPGVKELKCYVQRYADLKQAFGTNYDTPGTSSALYKAGMHWFKNGKAENRDYSC